MLINTVTPKEFTTVQTFDFQNDGALNWVGVLKHNAQPILTTGQGWTVGDTSGSYQELITPPNSVYNQETLKKVKIWIYKQDSYSYISRYVHSCGAGISKSDWIPYCMWIQARASTTPGVLVNNGSENWINTTDATGEITLEYICNDDGTFTLSVNGGTEQNLGNYATMFRNARSGGDLSLSIGRWASGVIYIRKVEITTVP